MDTLRKPLFLLALALVITNVLVELASTAILREARVSLDAPTPGMGIRYLAFIDLFLAAAVTLMGVALVVPERVHGKIVGITLLILAILVLIAAFLGLIVAFVKLMIMVALISSPPFGTAAYFALFAGFPVGTAAGTLGLILALKIAFSVCLILAHQRFLQNKGLVTLILVSIIATIVVKFLHSFVPRFLASITDAIGAVILAIVGIVWSILVLIGAIISIVKVLRVDRAFR